MPTPFALAASAAAEEDDVDDESEFLTSCTLTGVLYDFDSRSLGRRIRLSTTSLVLMWCTSIF